jgi:hypothetical protein
MCGTRLALRPNAGDEDGAQARVVTRVRAVRQDKSRPRMALALRIAANDAAALAALGLHAQARD